MVRFAAVILLVGVLARGEAPSVPLAVFKAEPSVPPIRSTMPTTLMLHGWPSKPPLRAFHLPWRCNCGGLGFVLDLSEGVVPPDPLPLLSEAYRKAEVGELWLLDPSIDILASPPGTWDQHNHRTIAISHIRRFDDAASLASLFRLSVALVSDEPDEEYSWRGIDARTPIDAAIAALEFGPDVVISFGGPSITRIEVQLSRRRVLLHAPGGSGFFALESAAEEELLRLASETRTEPNRARQPTPMLVTPRADARPPKANAWLISDLRQ